MIGYDRQAHEVAAARRSYGRLVALLSARTRDVAGAEDALSEAFAAALVEWPKISKVQFQNMPSSSHSHSIILGHGNALIFQCKFFLPTVKIRPTIRQIFSLLISKDFLP